MVETSLENSSRAHTHARPKKPTHIGWITLTETSAAAEYILAKSDPLPVKSSLSSPDDEMH